MRRQVGLLLALVAVPLCPATVQGAAPSLEVAATMFRVALPDGRVLASPELIGQAHQQANQVLSPWEGFGVFCLWTAVLLLIAGYLLKTRDA